MSNRTFFLEYGEKGKAFFVNEGKVYSCEEKILEKSGIIRSSLKENEHVQLDFDLGMDKNKVSDVLGEKEILGVKRLSNNNFYIELYKKKFYKYYKKKDFKLENKHLKGIPKPSFEGEYEKLFPALAKRQATAVVSLCAHNTISNFQPEWHLTIGLGITSLFETSINLNRVYGVPYIPSSSLKGAIRSHTINAYFEDEADALSSSVFCDLFGCPKSITKEGIPSLSYYKREKAGSLIFFDAYPLPTKSTLQIANDIMNPHYSDSYKEDLPPADWQQPSPVNFLVVRGTPFQFAIGLKKGADNEETILGEKNNALFLTPIQMATHLLKETLTTQGIGAKTAVGYGFME